LGPAAAFPQDKRRIIFIFIFIFFTLFFIFYFLSYFYFYDFRKLPVCYCYPPIANLFQV